MSGLEIVGEVISVLQALRQLYNTLKGNAEECRRLLQRCLNFDETIRALQSAPVASINAKQAPLARFEGVVKDAKVFVDKYTEKTVWRYALKVAKRNEYTRELADLNNRINACAIDLTLATVATPTHTPDQQRLEDLDDFRIQTQAIFDCALVEMKDQGDATQEAIAQLRQDLLDNKAVLKSYFDLRGYRKLQDSEINSITDALSHALDGKFDELKQHLVHRGRSE